MKGNVTRPFKWPRRTAARGYAQICCNAGFKGDDEFLDTLDCGFGRG